MVSLANAASARAGVVNGRWLPARANEPKVPCMTEAARFRLFVYGSLLSGEADHGLLAGAELLGPARTEPIYSLVDLRVYPALIAEGTTEVVGELYLVDAKTRMHTDVCKQCPILFERAPVRLAGGEEAESYFMDVLKVGGRRRIWNGDWKNRLAPRPRSSAAGPFVGWAKGRFDRR